MSKQKIINAVFWIALTSAVPALAFFKVPDTDFGANYSLNVTEIAHQLLLL